MTLLLGDCMELLPAIPDRSVDLIVADPPYGTTACKWDSPLPLQDLWPLLWRCLRPDGAVVLTAAQPFTSKLVASALPEFHQALVWRKNKASGHLNAKKRHMVAHEDIIVFARRQPRYTPQMWTSRPSNGARQTKPTPVYGAQKQTEYPSGRTSRYPRTVLDFPVVNNDGSNGGRFHPTQKPVELLAYLIQTYSAVGDTVLDFTMGSGSTGVACLATARDFIGIEKDPDFFAIARDRIVGANKNAVFG